MLTRRRFVLGALALVAMAGPALGDGGFRIEGDTLDDVKLVFDSKGLERSSPEASARSLITVMLGMKAAKLEGRVDALTAEYEARNLHVFLAPEVRAPLVEEHKRFGRWV